MFIMIINFYHFQPRVDQYFTQINKIIQARITSSRVRFMMQDVVDLRNNGWVPRREDNNPKTIDQIHKEAADEAKKAQLRIQMDKQQDKKMPRGKFANSGVDIGRICVQLCTFRLKASYSEKIFPLLHWLFCDMEPSQILVLARVMVILFNDSHFDWKWNDNSQLNFFDFY